MIVLLFDIDGTLVQTGGAGMAALHAALRAEFGVVEPHRINLSGRTDRGIAGELFEVHGIEPTEPNWDRFQQAYLHNLTQELPRRDGRVLPGVIRMLETLRDRPRCALGLLTGNVRAGAELKLQHYGLSHYFGFGGFGDQHAHRDAVAAEALAASRRHVDQEPRAVWVIGDTPLDVQCARAIGARALAVATGSHTPSELKHYAPDILLESLEEAGTLYSRLDADDGTGPL